MEIDQVITRIAEIEPATSLMPVKTEWIAAADEQYPGMPDDLRRLYTEHGYGCIGESRYMIHCLLDPGDVYDPETARRLKGVMIVGDDFAGNCEAYDAANGWQFGTVGSSGRFERYEVYSSFTDFLKKWFVEEM